MCDGVGAGRYEWMPIQSRWLNRRNAWHGQVVNKINWIATVLLITCGSVAALAWEIQPSDINLPAWWVHVELSTGGHATLYKQWGRFHVKWNATKQFEGTVIINWVVFIVDSNEPKEWGLRLTQYTSQIWVDYSQFWEMGSNFLSWEIEFLESIEKIIETKPEKLRGIIRNAYHSTWQKALYSAYDWDWEMKWAHLDLLLQKTPNMVRTWKYFWWEYEDIFKNQQATERNKQETMLYNALNR